MPRYVSKEDLERERTELSELRSRYDRSLRRQRNLNQNVRRWERNLSERESAFDFLRAVGFIYLRAPQRIEYRRLRDLLIPAARERLNYWQVELDRHFREVLLPLREQIRSLEWAIAEKVVVALFRVKIRIYNIMSTAKSPEGMFQGFFDIDALLDPTTNLPDWNWWLTKEEVGIAKVHFVGYFKGMATWNPPEQTSLAMYPSEEAIPISTTRVSYRAYHKNIPQDFISKAEQLTVKELITGLSSKTPEPLLEVKAENMGVFFERAMIIDPDGFIKWDEIRDRWVWHPPEEYVRKVKEELGL